MGASRGGALSLMNDSDEEKTHEARLRIGVLGANGQLGRCLVRSAELVDDVDLVFGVTRTEIDLTAREKIGVWLDSLSSDLPDVVINAAAYTKVDKCESEKELAYETNALAPAEWTREMSKRGVRFIHVSTDYVFPGDGDQPYREEDPTDPKTVYGSSKRAGEIAVLGTDSTALVVRTSWVFGPGRNFVVAILGQAARRRSGELEGPLKVVDDQYGVPTSAADLAEALIELARRGRTPADRVSGLLHLQNSSETTWYGFAREILDQAGYSDIAIDPVPSSAFETAAPRPAYSVLNCDRAAQLGIALRPWNEALASYLSGPDVPTELLAAQNEMIPQETPK